MTNPRLELALKQLDIGAWHDFEQFAAEFLAVEYPSLRSTASPSGDRGRDGEVFAIDGEPDIGAQYSVAQDYNKKITETLKRLHSEGIKYSHLIYATNQYIGANGDSVRQKARHDYHVMLDIRDRSWFLERELTYPQRATASEQLIRKYADPLLAQEELRDRAGIALTRDEGRIALLHLALENRDIETDRSLTRSCFEALVLAALHETHSGSTRSVSDIQNDIRNRVPTGADGQVDALTLGTLGRLSKRGPVKHVRSSNSYHLSFEATKEMNARSAQFLLEEETIKTELSTVLVDTIDTDRAESIDIADVRAAVDAVLFDRGESFVAAIESGEMFQLDPDQIAKTLQARGITSKLTLDEMTAVVLGMLRTSNTNVRRHLARLGDAYTLFAFLRQTPDVQKVVVNLFSDGDIWLDTSIVLPLIAETLIENSGEREFTLLMRATRDAGLRLHVTEGVIEEVERHLNRCYAYASTNGDNWTNRIPFLYTAYILGGGTPAQFNSWRTTFSGKEQPEEDISDFLLDEYGIDTSPLTEHSDSASTELRGAVQELWNEAHDRRRTDAAVRHRLVSHDVENAVGVIQFRKSSERSPMGHRAWWLTIDKTANGLGKHLRERLGKDAPQSPVLSPDFLSQLLRLSPLRKAIEHDTLIDLPTATDMTLFDYATPKLLSEAASVREQVHSNNARILRRNVRDEMERRRRKLGPKAIGGARAMETQILAAIEGKNSDVSLSDSGPVV